MSYCAATWHAISGRPRSSLGDTIPSCPQQGRLLRSSLRVAPGDTIESCPQHTLAARDGIG
ncbi:MAG: hypothetical protein V3T81_07475 [Thermoanaerobaculia bacterium]